MRAKGQEIGEVHEHEKRQNQIDARPANERDDEPERADDQNGTKPVPEPHDERDRCRVVVLEAQPAVSCALLHLAGLVPRLVTMDEHERARGEEPHSRERNRAREARPGCVILDLKMPRLGGFEALPAIRQAAPRARVIVLTGSPNRPLREACRAQGADEFMLKPFDPGELLRLTARAFDRD